MKERVTSFYGRVKRHSILNIGMLALIIIAVQAYTFYVSIDSEKARWQNSSMYIDDLEWGVIETTLYDEIYKAQIQTDLVSELITKDIKHEYSNLINVGKDIDSLDVNSPIYEILNENIERRFINEDNIRNKIFVTTLDKILSTSYSPLNNFKRGMDVYDFFGKDKDDQALEKIIQDGECYTLISSDDTFNGSTIIELKKLYMEKEVEGLKNIYLLVPSFITENGDIIGIKDINNFGEKQRNHKLIVVQQISVYEAIRAQEDLMHDFKHAEQLDNIQHKDALKESYMRNYMVLGLLLALTLITIFSYKQCDESECDQ